MKSLKINRTVDWKELWPVAVLYVKIFFGDRNVISLQLLDSDFPEDKSLNELSNEILSKWGNAYKYEIERSKNDKQTTVNLCYTK